MTPLYTNEEFKNSKCLEKLPLQCENCGNIFYKSKHYIQISSNRCENSMSCCSTKCAGEFKSKRYTLNVNCGNCGIPILKLPKDMRKSKTGLLFCSRSCNATYGNTHKTTGTRRSKLEIYLEEQLQILYPNLEFHFNRKDTIDSELDIYIPSLRLAFELNGIFHYEPIYGKDKLDKIQNNDNNKFQKCIENNISLCIIDTSQQNRFTVLSSQKYLDIIVNIINISGHSQI